MCKVPGEFQIDFCREMEDVTFCPTERKTFLTNLRSQQYFNWFRLDSDGAHKVHKCTSNISLYSGFKELSVKGLKTASKHCVLHNAVSYLNKGLSSSYQGEKTIIHIILVQNFTRDTLPRKNLIFAEIHKSAKSMLQQHSGAALVRHADIKVTVLLP